MNIPTPAEVHAVAVRRGQYAKRPSRQTLLWHIYGEWREAFATIKKRRWHELLAHELADVILCCISVAHHLGIDIEAAVREKHEINIRRADGHKAAKGAMCQ